MPLFTRLRCTVSDELGYHVLSVKLQQCNNMPICGVTISDRVRGAQIVSRMLAALNNAQAYTQKNCAHDGAAFGVASTTSSVSLYQDSQVLVAFDGELYDRDALTRRLSNETARTGKPAALIAALYEHYGRDFLKELDGVFSIAIWDRATGATLLARDRLGIRSICYAVAVGSLLFASYPQSILATQLIDKRVCFRAIADYLNFNVVPAPQSAYRDVYKLMPGEYLVWQGASARKTRYWQLQYTERATRNVKTLSDRLLAQLDQAVQVTSGDLASDKVGCFLSGGTDSSSIAGLYGRSRREPVPSFSIGFEEERFDELYYARLAAKHFGLKHFVRILHPADALRAIPEIVELFDEPFANSSVIPTRACIELAKDHGVSAMLAGDGGDELFGGNERYRKNEIYQIYQRLPLALRRAIEPSLFASSLEHGIIGKAKNYIRRSNIPNPDRYCQWRLLQKFSASAVLGSSMPYLNGDAIDFVREYYRSAPASSDLNRLLYIDLHLTLSDEDIPKVARTAEQLGVRVRFPYLHQSLAEFSGSLPVHMKVRRLEKRYLFKRATRNLLPKEIIHKKKHGFGLPIGVWLKTDPGLREFSRDILLSPLAYQRGYFQRAFVEKLLAGLNQDDTPYFGDLLWPFLMLELWHRRHVDGGSA